MRQLIVMYLFFFVLPVFNASGQDEDYEEVDEFKLIHPKHSYQIDFNLPVSIKNKAFKGMMQGLVRSGVGYQYNLKNGIALGLGYQYTFFQINKFKTPQQVHGGLHINSGYVKVGWDKFFNERLGIDLHVKAGYSSFTYYSDSLERLNGSKNLQAACFYMEPSCALVLTGNKNTSYKWVVTYSFQQMGFSPQQIGILANAGYDPLGFKRKIQFLAFGFSFSHYFRQR